MKYKDYYERKTPTLESIFKGWSDTGGSGKLINGHGEQFTAGMNFEDDANDVCIAHNEEIEILKKIILSQQAIQGQSSKEKKLAKKSRKMNISYSNLMKKLTELNNSDTHQ